MATLAEHIMAGKADETINEVVGDIIPGAHVAFTQYNAPEDAWTFTIVMPALPDLVIPADVITDRADMLAFIAGAASELALQARRDLLISLGIEVPE